MSPVFLQPSRQLARPEPHESRTAYLCLFVLALSSLSASVSAQADNQTPRRICPDIDENALAAEQALCWFQREKSEAKQCALVNDPVTECIVQANLWCVDATLDTNPVTNACFLSAVRAGQLQEASDIARYLRAPTKTASTCIAALRKTSVRIVSNPPGAEVLVDERSYGATPVEVTLTGNWWESRIKGVLGTDSEPVVVEVSSKELIDAFDRKACVFGDLIIDVSAERASTPSEAVTAPPTDKPQDGESAPTSTTSERKSIPTIQEADSFHPGTGSATDDDEDSLLPYIFMGAGGVLLVGGLVTGIMYLSTKAQLQDNCDDSAKICDADQGSNLEEAKTLAVATDVLLLTGLASLGVGIVLKILESNNTDASTDSMGLLSEVPRLSMDCSSDGCFGSMTLGF